MSNDEKRNNAASAMPDLTWEDTEKAIGTPFFVDHGADAVTEGWIRWWNEVLEVGCPMYYDKAVAAELGHPDIPAPATFAFIAAASPFWSPGDPEGRTDPFMPKDPAMFVPKPRTTRGFATDVDAEFLHPIYPGDRLTRTAKLVSVTRKRLKTGDGAFFTIESTYTNQNDVEVAKMRITCWNGNPVKEGE